VHLFERDCSVQRRHQKVIEESPSPGLSPGVRARMGEAAVAAARAVGYRNAGTVEFLVHGEGDAASFHFLEMNTRLQVEHPVTEAVTGVDLVHAQLAVAAGERLPWSQDALSQRGHAIECRVYAEDPSAGFLPQAGRLARYIEPSGPGIRVDSGVDEGDEISVHYDPLIAKLVIHSATRESAIARARTAIEGFVVLGIRTNLAFLRSVVDHQGFRAGAVDVTFVERESPSLVCEPPAELRRAAAAAALIASLTARTTASQENAGDRGFPARADDPWASLKGWKL
jgi:acetyl/propionyl-CoA carboxylase alpha subunit